MSDSKNTISKDLYNSSEKLLLYISLNQPVKTQAPSYFELRSAQPYVQQRSLQSMRILFKSIFPTESEGDVHLERDFERIYDAGLIKLTVEDEPTQLWKKKFGEEVSPIDVPTFVSERLGFRCRGCAKLSEFKEPICPQCGAAKYQQETGPPTARVATTRRSMVGKEDVVIYERSSDARILMFTQGEQQQREKEINDARMVVIALTYVGMKEVDQLLAKKGGKKVKLSLGKLNFTI